MCEVVDCEMYFESIVLRAMNLNRELLRCSQKTDFFEKVNFDFNV